tara:strand:- start:339 stop:500 length:162 start_codon:yes stop_codon:yes gene_type:complete
LIISSNHSRLKIFSNNEENKDKFFEKMIIDFRRILGALIKELTLITTREELKI